MFAILYNGLCLLTGALVLVVSHHSDSRMCWGL